MSKVKLVDIQYTDSGQDGKNNPMSNVSPQKNCDHFLPKSIFGLLSCFQLQLFTFILLLISRVHMVLIYSISVHKL